MANHARPRPRPPCRLMSTRAQMPIPRAIGVEEPAERGEDGEVAGRDRPAATTDRHHPVQRILGLGAVVGSGHRRSRVLGPLIAVEPAQPAGCVPVRVPAGLDSRARIRHVVNLGGGASRLEPGAPMTPPVGGVWGSVVRVRVRSRGWLMRNLLPSGLVQVKAVGMPDSVVAAVRRPSRRRSSCGDGCDRAGLGCTEVAPPSPWGQRWSRSQRRALRVQ